MMGLMGLVLFFGIGVAGWRVCERLRLPAPAVLGAILFLGAAGVFGLPVTPPALTRPVLSVALGIILGLRFNVKIIGMVREILLTVLWLAALTFLAVLVLRGLGLDKTTAIFAATPGGITEISLMAMSFGANTFAVAILQLSRMLFTVLLVPFIARRNAGPGAAAAGAAPTGAPSPTLLDGAILAGLGAASAWGAGVIGVPAPNLVGPMIAVGAYTKLRKRGVKVHPNLQKLVQVGVGGLVGLSITRESLRSLPSYLVPMLCLNLILLGGCLVLALVLHRLTRWDLPTCFIATSPGGLSLMTLLAIEMGADSNRVVVLQVLRMVLVLVLTPLFGSVI